MITFRCEICDEERPSELIAVAKHQLPIPGVEATRNVNYCWDRSWCWEQAQTWPLSKEAERWRHAR